MTTEPELRSSDRILTTHVGSLVRPAALASLLKAQLDGEPVDPNELDACREAAVQEVVHKQAEIGLDVVSDGEFGKSISWSRYVLERMSGFKRRPTADEAVTMPKAVFGRDRAAFSEFYAEYDPSQASPGMRGWVVTGDISYTGMEAIDRDIATFKRALAGAPEVIGFLPAVSPTSVAPDRADEHYPSPRKSLEAIAEALRTEYAAIVGAGLMLQIDDAYFVTTYDTMETLADYRSWAGQQVEIINHALAGLPQDRTRFHVCWGSWNGPHVSDVELKDIVDILLKIQVGGYSIEMANPRHEHEWNVWRDVRLPDDRVLVPGVVSHATNVVEHPELVAERIVRLAKLVGRERVIASTDCGFAQGPLVRRVHPSIQWAKLKSLVEGAALATEDLWHGGRRV